MRSFFATLLILLGLGCAFVAYSIYIWHQPSVPGEANVVIEPGTGTRAIFKQLHDDGMIPTPWKIAVPFAMNGNLRSLKAGEYAFDAGMSPAQVFSKISRGEVVAHKVTVPEGFTVAQIRALLLKEPLLTGELPAVIEEGTLFPDTWLFQRGDTRQSVIDRMQRRMTQELEAAWKDRDEAVKLTSPREALILASIVEAETAVAAERALVARVYLNRLAIPMRLQSDPTVAYGIAPGGMTRMLTIRDLERDHPYNTYTRDGLPPGPINNPGKAAIHAVMHPDASDALYFVATGDGGHRFAVTVNEHEANVRAYRQFQREQRAQQRRTR